MSAQNYLKWFRETWPIILTIAAVVWVPISFMALGIWAKYGGDFIDYARDELGITELQEMVAEATGANRVIKLAPGGTYVREPVYLTDGEVILVMTFSRTDVGQACRYIGMVPIFTGEDGVEDPGEYKGPGRQYDTTTRRVEMRIALPEGITPGRTALNLQIQYQCGPETIFEHVGPIIFRILP